MTLVPENPKQAVKTLNECDQGTPLYDTQHDSNYETSEGPAAMVDSGACASLVRKSTLDAAMRHLNITELRDDSIQHAEYRFGLSKKL